MATLGSTWPQKSISLPRTVGSVGTLPSPAIGTLLTPASLPLPPLTIDPSPACESLPPLPVLPPPPELPPLELLPVPLLPVPLSPAPPGPGSLERSSMPSTDAQAPSDNTETSGLSRSTDRRCSRPIDLFARPLIGSFLGRRPTRARR